MDIALLQIFVEVMRRGSFASVAHDRNVGPSSISRAIAALEQELGVRLFQRTTRRLEPTEAGMIYLARVESVVEELEQARVMAADMSKRPRGTLRVTAPVTFAQLHLAPLFPELSKEYPDLCFEMLLTDQMVDLFAERIDLAIRLGPLSDSTLIANRLCSTEYRICASPGYLEWHGAPKTPEALSDHNCLLFPLPGFRSRWRFRDRHGSITEVPVHGRWLISNSLALRQCAIGGMGITLLPTWLVGQSLRAGELTNLFPDYDVTATEFDTAAWLLYPSRAYLPLKVRVFVDFLKAKFGNDPPWT